MTWKAVQAICLKKRFWKQLEIVIRTFKKWQWIIRSHLQWLIMWSEFSYVKQVFFLNNTFCCFFFIFSYSGYYLVFNLQQFILLGHLVQTARLAHHATLPSVPLSVQLLHALNSQNKESWTHLWVPFIWERNLFVGTQDCGLPQDGFHGLLLFQGP